MCSKETPIVFINGANRPFREEICDFVIHGLHKAVGWDLKQAYFRVSLMAYCRKIGSQFAGR